MIKTTSSITTMFLLCLVSYADDSVLLTVTNIVDLRQELKCNRIATQSVAADLKNDCIVAKVVADGSGIIVSFDRKTNKIQKFDCKGWLSSFIIRPNILINDSKIKYANSRDVNEIDLKTKQTSTFEHGLPVQLSSDYLIFAFRKNYLIHSLSNSGELKIDEFDTTKNKSVAHRTHSNVTTFCELEGDTLIATEKSLKEFEVLRFKQGVDKPEEVFAWTGYKCVTIGASKEYFVVCQDDGSIVFYSTDSKKVSKINRAVKRTPTNCIVADGKAFVTSLDRNGASNLLIFSCKDSKLLGSCSVDKGGALAMAVDIASNSIFVIGTEGILKEVSFSK